jgi:hypothetical protein
MPDEFEVELRRAFAAQQQPLSAEPFVSELVARLPSRGMQVQLSLVLRHAASGLQTGLRAALRLPRIGPALAAATLFALWAALA